MKYQRPKFLNSPLLRERRPEKPHQGFFKQLTSLFRVSASVRRPTFFRKDPPSRVQTRLSLNGKDHLIKGRKSVLKYELAAREQQGQPPSQPPQESGAHDTSGQHPQP